MPNWSGSLPGAPSSDSTMMNDGDDPVRVKSLAQEVSPRVLAAITARLATARIRKMLHMTSMPS